MLFTVILVFELLTASTECQRYAFTGDRWDLTVMTDGGLAELICDDEVEAQSYASFRAVPAYVAPGQEERACAEYRATGDDRDRLVFGGGLVDCTLYTAFVQGVR